MGIRAIGVLKWFEETPHFRGLLLGQHGRTCCGLRHREGAPMTWKTLIEGMDWRQDLGGPHAYETSPFPAGKRLSRPPQFASFLVCGGGLRTRGSEDGHQIGLIIDRMTRPYDESLRSSDARPCAASPRIVSGIPGFQRWLAGRACVRRFVDPGERFRSRSTERRCHVDGGLMDTCHPMCAREWAR